MPDYPYIRAWEKRIGSTETRTQHMLTVAQNEQAPPDAVFRRLNSTWATLEEIGAIEKAKVLEALDA